MKIPLKIQENEIESGKIYIPCEFDHLDDQNCHLDTGSSYTSVTWTPELDKYLVVDSTTRTSASGVSVDDDLIIFRSFGYKSFYVKNFRAVRYSQSRNQESRIGMSLFKDLNLSFNFIDCFLEVSKTRDDNLSYLLDVADNKLFYIRSKISEQEYVTLWDTGAELTVIDPELINEHKNNFEYIMDIPNGSDATGNSVYFKLYRMKGLDIGGHQLSGNVLVMDFAPLKNKINNEAKIILGFNHIRQLNWSFDLQNKKWDIY